VVLNDLDRHTALGPAGGQQHHAGITGQPRRVRRPR